MESRWKALPLAPSSPHSLGRIIVRPSVDETHSMPTTQKYLILGMVPYGAETVVSFSSLWFSAWDHPEKPRHNPPARLMKTKLLTLSTIAALSGGVAQAALLVNWGGDYVTGNANFARATANNEFAYPSGTGRSKVVAWNESTALNPSASYSGVSSTFYGGYFSSHDGTNTTAPKITTTARITESGTTDRIYLRLQTPADTSKTAASVGAGVAWLKSDFLNNSTATITFDTTSSLNITLQTLTSGVDLRWMVKDGTQWYVSNTTNTTSGSKSLSGASLLAETWLAFNPSTSLLEPSGTYASHSFTNITAVGYSGWMDISSALLTTSDIVVTAFSVNAIPEPSSALLGGLGLLAMLRRRRA